MTLNSPNLSASTRRCSLIVALLAVAIFALVVIAATDEPLQPQMSYDGPTYLSIAEHLLTRHRLPPLEMRPPLYPMLLALSLWIGGENGLQYLVTFQVSCWIACAVLVAILTYQICKNLALGVLTGILYTTLFETYSLIPLIYAETTAVALALASASTLIVATRVAGTLRIALQWGSAFLTIGAAYGRPIFQLLLPIFFIFVTVDSRWGLGELRKQLIPLTLVAFVGLAPWYVAHKVFRGACFFTKGFGYSLTNYLGDRRLLGHFPAEYEEVGRAYAQRFVSKLDRQYVGWWEVFPDWAQLYEKRMGSKLPADLIDADMAHTSLAVLLRNPRYYAMRWWETWSEFSTSASGVPAGRFSPIRLMGSLWRVFWKYLGLWLPFALIIGEVGFQAFIRKFRPERFLPIAVYLTIAFFSTAIEPWPGQIRYRSGIEAFLLVALMGNIAGWISSRS
jgi:hypothetical protein